MSPTRHVREDEAMAGSSYSLTGVSLLPVNDLGASLIDRVSDAILVVNNHGQVVLFNAAAQATAQDQFEG
jgi:hypothetical protein